jgi:hydrogenase expression/formation protein HypE
MERILLGHGSGGFLMHELIREYLAPSFDLAGMGDSAILDLNPHKIAFTTDSYVVSPIFFSGGDIGELAVFGTVNDLSVSGAMPLFLTAGFIIEEGFPMENLKKIVSSMSRAAMEAGVKIVAGDTKVVNRGKGDGIFINTAGIGIIYEGVSISPKNIKKGDLIIISGEIGSHGMAIMAERNGLSFDPPLKSDTTPLNGLVKTMIEASRDIHFMRDPTRGGLATTLKEAAIESNMCIRIHEDAIPIPQQVKGACELLGLDPLYIANEGVLIAIVGRHDAERILSVMRSHPSGRKATIIGEVDDSPEGMVLLRTSIGGNRIIEMLQGEQLPRIC